MQIVFVAEVYILELSHWKCVRFIGIDVTEPGTLARSMSSLGAYKKYLLFILFFRSDLTNDQNIFANFI